MIENVAVQWFSDFQERVMQADRELDVKGLSCPLPILRAKKALAEMAPGQILRVLATDPHVAKDFRAFARQTGNELIATSGNGPVFEFLFKRRPDKA